MGYTHYWYLQRGGIEAWKKRGPQVVSDFMALLPHLPPLAWADGKGKPEFGEIVVFNGRAPKEDYESFVFPYDDEAKAREEMREEGRVFGFCKTGFSQSEARSYDLAVMAFLLVAKLHMGEVLEVKTDGHTEDWLPAARLVEEVLALPVDLYEALGHRLWLVRAGEGKEFLYESGKSPPKELEEWLEKLERRGVRGWPFRGPYQVLREVRVPQDKLPALRDAKAGIFPVYRVPEEV